MRHLASDMRHLASELEIMKQSLTVIEAKACPYSVSEVREIEGVGILL